MYNNILHTFPIFLAEYKEMRGGSNLLQSPVHKTFSGH